MQVFSFCWLVLPFRERNNFIQTYNCIVFTDFQHTQLYPFQNFGLRFILQIFLKFRKFQPRYSYKVYSYKKKSVIKKECTSLKRTLGTGPERVRLRENYL